MLTTALLIMILPLIEARGKRIDIFSQNNGQGDIRQLRTAPNSKNVMLNSLPRKSPLRWTKVRDRRGTYVIPYEITGLYDAKEREIIHGAMQRIENNTCLRFKKRVNERDYIDIQNQAYEGCYTTVGRLTGKNVVMLEANEVATCIEPDIVIHELMHSIGLWHEHMRYDRDEFIKVHFENIDNVYYAQFEKVPKGESDTFGIKYDYQSVMHYAEDAFAKPGQISMQTIDPSFQKRIGHVRDASPSDYQKICILYQCRQCMGRPFLDPEAPPEVPVEGTERTVQTESVAIFEEGFNVLPPILDGQGGAAVGGAIVGGADADPYCADVLTGVCGYMSDEWSCQGLAARWCCASCRAKATGGVPFNF